MEQFATDYRHLRNGAYLDRSVLMSARQRIIAIVGETQGNPVVAGVAATIMHGSLWFDDDFTIELIRGPSASGRPASGTITHRLELPEADIVDIDGLRVTSPLRTAFDVGRTPPRWRAIGYLDALAAAIPIDLGQLAAFAQSQRGIRGVVQLRELVGLVDPTSESPGESSFRLFLHDVGLPKPQTQIEVFDDHGNFIARHDFGYAEHKIAIEYDGEEYHSTPHQLASDSARDVRSREQGWVVIRVNATRMARSPMGVVNEIEVALGKRRAYFN